MPVRAAGFWNYKRGASITPPGEPPPPPPPPVAPPFTFSSPAAVPFGRTVVRVADREGLPVGQLFAQVEELSWQMDGYGTATLLVSPDVLAERPYLVEFGSRIQVDFTGHNLPSWAGVIDPPREAVGGMIRVTAYEPGYLLSHRLVLHQEFWGGTPATTAAREMIQLALYPIPVQDTITGQPVEEAFYFQAAIDALDTLRRIDPELHYILEARNYGGDIDFQASVFAGYRADRTEQVIFKQGHNLADVQASDQGPVENRVIVASGDVDLMRAGFRLRRGELYGQTAEEPGVVVSLEDAASVERYGVREKALILPAVQDEPPPEDEDDTTDDFQRAGRAAQYGRGYLAANALPRRRMAGTAVNRPPAVWGSFRPGDRVTVELQPGLDRRGSRHEVAILSMTYAPQTGVLSLVFNQPGDV